MESLIEEKTQEMTYTMYMWRDGYKTRKGEDLEPSIFQAVERRPVESAMDFEVG